MFALRAGLCCYLNATLYALVASSALVHEVLVMKISEISTSSAAVVLGDDGKMAASPPGENRPPPANCVIAQFQTLLRAMVRMEDRPISSFYIMSALPWIRSIIALDEERTNGEGSAASSNSATSSSNSGSALSESSQSSERSGKEEIEVSVASTATDECACSADCDRTMQQGGQQDMSEFFINFMEVLKATCAAHHLRDSSDLFSFSTSSTVACKRCLNSATTESERQELVREKVEFNNCFFGHFTKPNMSVMDMIRAYFVNEEERGEVICSAPFTPPGASAPVHAVGSKERTVQTISLLTLPHALAFFTVRQAYSRGGEVAAKINLPISVDFNVSLDEFVVAVPADEENTTATSPSSSSSYTTKRFVSDLRYKPYCIVIHKGRSVKGGHYISYVCQPKTNDWLCCDDSVITKVNDIFDVLETLPRGLVVFAVFYRRSDVPSYSIAALRELVPPSFVTPRSVSPSPAATAAVAAATPARRTPAYGLSPLMTESLCRAQGLVCFRMVLIISALISKRKFSRTQSPLAPSMTVTDCVKTAWRYTIVMKNIKKGRLQHFREIAEQVIFNFWSLQEGPSVWWKDLSSFIRGVTVELPLVVVHYLTCENPEDIPVLGTYKTGIPGMDEQNLLDRRTLLPEWVLEWASKSNFHEYIHGTDEAVFTGYLPTQYAAHIQERQQAALSEQKAEESEVDLTSSPTATSPSKAVKKNKDPVITAASDLLGKGRKIFAGMTDEQESGYVYRFPAFAEAGKAVKAPPFMMTKEYLYHVVRPVQRNVKCCVCRRRVYKSVARSRVDSGALLTHKMLTPILDDETMKNSDVYALARSLWIIAEFVEEDVGAFAAYLCSACGLAIRTKTWPFQLVISHAAKPHAYAHSSNAHVLCMRACVCRRSLSGSSV